ncbi:MAG: endonuclease domain-containing protein [Armatimonadetes bacterium]|nr:endonuclease domain-containing protein [Armatimonadota bacterium]
MRENPTKAEAILWNELKSRKLNEYKFRFQAPYDNFILDFLCSKYKLIIELDGKYHENFKMKDTERDNYFNSKGYRILRFKNDEVFNNIELVKKKIIKAIKQPHPNLPLSRGRKESPTR